MFMPILIKLNIDKVWFAILVAVTLQSCWLSPPVALSAYYLKGVVPDWDLTLIYKGMIPFLGLQAICVVILYLFPQITLFLPNLLFGR
jgi:TRAP-type mannitol/chloroaromatic compound transport system permease large subunit